MRKNYALMISLLSLFYVAAVMAAAPGYVIQLKDPQNWKIGHQQTKGNSFIQEFVRSNEDVNAWSEILTISHMEQPTKTSVETVVTRIINGLKNGCPSFRHSVLSSNQTEVMFRWSDEGCGNWPAQEGVMRIIATDNGVFNFQYAYIKSKASPSFDEWVKILSAAKVVP
jgi:hypothetical protein